MGEYRNYVRDFPRRCVDLLESFGVTAEAREREVTLLLSVAMAGLIVPHERLKPPRRKQSPHPSGDHDHHVDAARRYSELLEQPFLSSPLWPDRGARSWRKGEVKDVQREGPYYWRDYGRAKHLGSNVLVWQVLKVLRNGLAHGNIITQGHPIRRVMLLNRQKHPLFEFISVSPDDLRRFLMNYVEFLSTLHLNDALIGRDDEAA